MDPATSELAQVITMATSIVGAGVYLQRAQMAALTKLAELLKPDGAAPITVKLDADQSGRFAEVIARALDVREEVRDLDTKVDTLGRDVGVLTGRMHSKPPRSPRATANKS